MHSFGHTIRAHEQRTQPHRRAPVSASVAVLVAVALAVAASTTAASAYDVALSWDRVDQAVGYRVFVRYDTNSFVATTDSEGTALGATRSGAGGRIRHTVTGLPIGPTVFFRVSAFDATNESLRSNELSLSYADVAGVVDSDGDGLVDALEDSNLNGTLDEGETDARDADSDDDGLMDGDEVLRTGTDPLDADSDGDGVIDSADSCHDIDADGFGAPGMSQSTCPLDNCLYDYNADQSDIDADGRGDLCDPCTNVAGGQDIAIRTAVVLKKVGADPMRGNDVLRISGRFHLPGGTDYSVLNPLERGVRVLITAADGTVRVDISLPAAPLSRGRRAYGWYVNRSGDAWTYIDKRATTVDGIKKLVIKNLERRSPKLVELTVKGKRGHYPVVPGDEPVQASVVLGDQLASLRGECGETRFSPGQCLFRRGNRTLVCRP